MCPLHEAKDPHDLPHLRDRVVRPTMIVGAWRGALLAGAAREGAAHAPAAV